MAMTDPLGDMLARIRNGQKARQAQIACPAAKLHTAVLSVLKDEGYIRGYADRDVRKGVRETVIDLKYYEGEPVIKELSRVSTPGRRVYSAAKNLRREYGGLGISIVSTPQGVMSDSQARAKNVGGEVLCRVY
jgi:small subunit ribosomal protein S8